MRLLPVIALASALSGCGSHWAGYMSTGGTYVPAVPAPAATGTTVVSGPPGLTASVTISGSAANFLYWFTGAGIYGAMLMDDYRGGAWFTPSMKADRAIAEVDCTKPIPPEVTGNIKCR